MRPGDFLQTRVTKPDASRLTIHDNPFSSYLEMKAPPTTARNCPTPDESPMLRRPGEGRPRLGPLRLGPFWVP